VKVQLRVLSGALAGQVTVFSKETVSLGRHPEADFRFDPDNDLEVSARHAVIVGRSGRWLVRDLGSLNGTLVNGHVIAGDTGLDDTDQIRFGPDGPLVEFRLVPDSTPDGMHAPPTRPPPSDGARVPPPTSTPARPTVPPREQRPAASGTTQRIKVEVGRQTRRLRFLAGALFVVVILAVTGLVFESGRQRRLREREVAALEARTDSLLQAASAAMEALQGQVSGLAAALSAAHAQVERLRRDLTAAQQSGSAEEVRELRRRLADANQALLYRQAAAYVDYAAIAEANQRAVAMVWADLGQGTVNSGTGFAVRDDGTMVTSRHVVTGKDGTGRPLRLAVKFADSYQVYPARYLGAAPDVDVALLRVQVPGGVPTVHGINARPDTLAQGDPMAVLGFPLGSDLPMTQLGRDRTVARTSFVAASVSKTLPDVIQLDGYGAEGSSGSPILDGNGEVVGVVYGGLEGSDGRVVLGVPSTHILRLMAAYP